MKTNEKETRQPQAIDLEILIDQVGLQAVLLTIADICEQKASHIIESYDDEATAKPWDGAAGAVRYIASKSHHIKALPFGR